jgi:rare lipoprotein A
MWTGKDRNEQRHKSSGGALRWSLLVLASVATSACGATLGTSAQIGDSESGSATWYGKGQHGGPTASGERFNMYAFTAAHRRLRFGSQVRVENLRNGLSVVVRINDRGPYSRGRIIDLSYAAAQRLDMLQAGVVPVRIRVLSIP